MCAGQLANRIQCICDVLNILLDPASELVVQVVLLGFAALSVASCRENVGVARPMPHISADDEAAGGGHRRAGIGADGESFRRLACCHGSGLRPRIGVDTG